MNATPIIDLLWKQVPETLFISREDFERSLIGWTVEPYERNGQPAFAILVKGPEFHCVSFETGCAIPKSAIWKRVMEIVDQHGYATTKTPRLDTRQHEINRHVGFVMTGSDEYDIHYRLDRPHRV